MASTKANLEEQGIHLQDTWIEDCISHIRAKAGPRILDDRTLLNKVYQTFLHFDLRQSGIGCFPPNILDLEDRVLSGPFILQIEAIKNIGQPCETREQESASRCLLLALTDGISQIIALEYRRIPELKISTPIGTKLAVRNVRIRDGMMLLLPEILEVLGGRKGSKEPGGDGAAAATGGTLLQLPAAAGIEKSGGGVGGGRGDDGLPMNRQQQPLVGGRGGGAPVAPLQTNHPPPPLPAARRQMPSRDPSPPAVEEIDLYDDDGIDWAEVQIPSQVAQRPPPPPPQPRPSTARTSLQVSPRREEPAVVISLLDEDEKQMSSQHSAALAIASSNSAGSSHMMSGEMRNTNKGIPSAITGGSCRVNNLSSPGAFSTMSSQSMPSQSQPYPPHHPCESDGPYVALCEWQRFAGREVPIKAFVSNVISVKVGKKNGLKIVVQIDDGSGLPMDVRLSGAMTAKIIGMGKEDFRALFDRDRAAAATLVSKCNITLATLEGVFMVRMPSSTTEPCPTPVLVSCRSPSTADLQAFIKVCGYTVDDDVGMKGQTEMEEDGERLVDGEEDEMIDDIYLCE